MRRPGMVLVTTALLSRVPVKVRIKRSRVRPEVLVADGGRPIEQAEAGLQGFGFGLLVWPAYLAQGLPSLRGS